MKSRRRPADKALSPSMNIFLGPKVLPSVLAQNGVRVWVGDAVPKPGTLDSTHQHLLIAFLYKDMDREIVVMFMTTDPHAVKSDLLRHCRRWAAEQVFAILA